MSTLLQYAFSVTGLTLALLALVAVSLWRRAPGRGRGFIATVACACALSTIYVAPYAVSRLLTVGYRPFEPGDVGAGTTAIVLLGGGDDYITGWTGDLTVSRPIEEARTLEARRVFRLLPDSWIISSGGQPARPVPVQPSSVVMRDELVRLGAPADRILLESSSLTTYDEAVLIAPMLASLHVQHVVLVTTDTHMRRALGAFRAASIRAVPAIAPDPRRPIHAFEWLLPTDRGLDLTHDVVHELIGIPYYWARGWWRR